MVFILITYKWQKERNKVGVHPYEVLIIVPSANAICPLAFGKRYQNDYFAADATHYEAEASNTT